MSSVFLQNMQHAFLQTDGSYKWPNSFEGDQLKQAKTEIDALRVRLGYMEAYVQHATGCQRNSFPLVRATDEAEAVRRSCNCGLDALLAGEEGK